MQMQAVLAPPTLRTPAHLGQPLARPPRRFAGCRPLGRHGRSLSAAASHVWRPPTAAGHNCCLAKTFSTARPSPDGTTALAPV